MSAAATRDELRSRLAEHDDWSVTLLGEAEAALRDQPHYIDALIELAGSVEAHASAGATWLIKSSLEKGRILDGEQTVALVGSLPNVTNWAAQLHLCQSMRMLEVPIDKAEAVAVWLSPLLEHKRPFVRAWALDALAHVADCDCRFSGCIHLGILRRVAADRTDFFPGRTGAAWL